MPGMAPRMGRLKLQIWHKLIHKANSTTSNRPACIRESRLTTVRKRLWLPAPGRDYTSIRTQWFQGQAAVEVAVAAHPLRAAAQLLHLQLCQRRLQRRPCRKPPAYSAI